MKLVAFDHLVTQQQLTGTLSRAYEHWIAKFDRLTEEDRHAISAHIRVFAQRPIISIVMPVYNTAEEVLVDAALSVINQLYPHWELCIADDCSTATHIPQVLERLAKADARIKWVRRAENGHIAAASNSALDLATGTFVALFDHDDLLSERALYEVAVEINRHPDACILYTDEDKVDDEGNRYDPYFKTGFSLNLLLAQNFFNHLTVYRKSLIEAVGGFRVGFEGSQDYDLALRAVARTAPENIHHVPFVLYHWRQTSERSSFSQTYLDSCAANGRRAVEEFLNGAAHGLVAVVDRLPSESSWNRVRWLLPRPAPLVSVIIPIRDQVALLKQCLSGLFHRTAYPSMEILIVDNNSVEEETLTFLAELRAHSRVRVINGDGPFNYSALNNLAARAASGSILLLLNNDIDVINPEWLSEMVSLMSGPNVGVVGAKLLYSDGRLQHAGVRLGAGTFDGGPGIAGHLGLFHERSDRGYFGSLTIARDVSAVTGACLAIRRELYEAVGGLDAENLSVAFNDIDLCLKAKVAGYRVIWTPFAELYHLESASRGSDLTPEKIERFHKECWFMRTKWGVVLQTDPFYHRVFNNFESDYMLDLQTQYPRSWAGCTRDEPGAERCAVT